MAKEENTSIMRKINYAWQTFSLSTPIFMLLYILMRSAVNMSIEGVIIFSVIIFLLIVNELLSAYNILNSIIPEERSSTCGVLNFNRNYFMMNSTIILSFVLGFYGLNMYFNNNLNIAFLTLLSFFLFMDMTYYVLICSRGVNIFKHLISSIIYGGTFGLAWSYFHSLIFGIKTDKDNNSQGPSQQMSIYTVYNNGQQVASGSA